MTNVSRWLLWGMGACGASMVADGCVIVDPDHCANRSGYQCANGNVCDPCSRSDQTVRSDGCVDVASRLDRDLERNGCQLDDGGVTDSVTDGPSTTETGLTTTIGETETDTATTTDETGPNPDCTAPDGELDAVCPADRPFCVGQQCQPCTDAAVDCGQQFCDADGGACVECTEVAHCEGATPICGADNTCVGCTEHAQCFGEAEVGAGCNLFEGSCLPDSEIYYVDNGAANCAAGDGTAGDPVCDPEAALSLAGPEATIHIMGGAQYNSPVDVVALETIAFIGTGDPWLFATGGPNAIRVFGVAYLSGVRLEIDGGVGTAAAMVTPQGQLWIDDSIVEGSPVGVQSSGVQLHMRRTLVLANRGGGIDVSGGVATLENTIVAANGAVTPTPGIVVSAGELNAVYTTVAGNLSGAANGLTCTKRSTVTMRNSIVVSPNAQVSIGCPTTALSVSHTATDSTVWLMQDATNLEVVSGELGFDAEFHIAVNEALQGLPERLDDDPLDDIDRELRDLQIDYPGADHPQP